MVSLSFFYSFTRSLVETLLKKDSVLTYIALSTVLWLIDALTVATALLWHRHSCVEVAEWSNSTLHLFANLPYSSLPFSLSLRNALLKRCRCPCWVYMYTVPTGTYQEHFSSCSLPYPWLVFYCLFSSGIGAPAQWVRPKDLFT